MIRTSARALRVSALGTTLLALLATSLNKAGAQEGGSAQQTDHVVGTTRIVIPARTGSTLPVQVWYPAVEGARAEANVGRPPFELEPPGPARDELRAILESGQAGCPNLTAHVAIDAAISVAERTRPLIVVSHHFAGTRLSTLSINERLARGGFVVAAVDHVGGTLPEMAKADLVAQTAQLLGGALKTRASDLSSVLDALLDGSEVVPAWLHGVIDPARIGVYGHSMGAITTGLVQVDDARVRAAAFLSMIPTSPTQVLLQGAPSIERFRVPALYVLAQEDAVIAGAGGNEAFRAAYRQQRPPAWLVEVRDMGHFSLADDLAAHTLLIGGCGEESRVTRAFSRYTNIDPTLARQITARYVTDFFSHQFLGSPASSLGQAIPPELVVTSSHP